MKYLSDYTQDKQTAVFDKFGAFFAFSDKQFKDKQQDGVKYASLGAGLIAPVEHAKELAKSLKSISQDAIQQDIAENGIKAIIHRELGNHECQITMDYDDVVDVLAPYGITKEQIKAEFNEFMQVCIDNDYF